MRIWQSTIFITASFLLTHQTHSIRTPSIVGTGKSIQGSRDYQQDRFYLAKHPNTPVLALICDGHGDKGDIAAGKITHLLTHKLNNASYSDDQTVNIHLIKSIFTETNELLRKHMGKNGNQSGTTCLALLCIKNSFYMAHVGDSRALWGIKQNEQTNDHTGKNMQEVKRVGAHHIHGPQKRLGGSLMVTRAFGDFALTKDGLTAEPDITVVPMDTAPFIILGCDGIWDGSSNSFIYSLMYNTIVTQKESVEIACKRILAGAICSTLQNRAAPLMNLFHMSSRKGKTGLLIREISPVSLDNAVEKIDPYKKEMILALSLAQLNDFIKRNQKYCHDNTTAICLYNKEANISESPK
jgi:serine/threonine protein phosphatase PrpC